MVSDRKAAPSRRKPAGGRVRNEIAVPAERDRAQLRQAAERGKKRRGNGIESGRGGPDERDTDL